ncbi:hypothetical protein DYI24_00030 [Rhodopseudomonas sp. BR0C11]|uniref:phage tail terminator-like protein n=1 Tax=Rhodopseudomonas sp. BR0C11 TaxID=2269370 RepID=UPI0013E0AD84|nr:phage tail terminator-like protein [Rhodopseudomonas sp. BR0C11]NEV75468.1 hypothetical protein [Rhodopseudomonas sp. BR0C11]
MDAPYDDVYDAIKEHLDNNWDSTLASIYFENDYKNDEPDDAPDVWVLVVLDTNLYAQQSIGGGDDAADNRWDEDGTLWFHVFVPRGIGSRESRRIAKALANLFRGVKLLDGELEFLDADLGSRAARGTANVYATAVSIDWRRPEAQ